MKKSLTLAVFAVIGSMFAADLSNNLLFEADYRTGSATPTVAKGSKKYRTLLSGKVQFKDGGLIVGPESASIRYEMNGNIAPKEGTIEIYVKNLDYQMDDNEMHMYFACSAPDSLVYIYKFKKDGLGSCFVLKNGTERKTYFPRQMMKNLDPEPEFRHLVAVYTPDSYSFYVDGRLCREIEGEIECNFVGKDFIIGASGNKMGRGGNSWIGFVRTYDRALAESEIAQLAKEAKPTK